MIHAEILNGIPFIYNMEENDHVINNVINSQKETFSSDKNDIISMGYTFGSMNDTFICLDKDSDGRYNLVGYLPFSMYDFGFRLNIEFIFGVNDNMINILLDRIKVYAFSNRYASISASIKINHLGIFIRNGYIRTGSVLDDTGDILRFVVTKKFSYGKNSISI